MRDRSRDYYDDKYIDGRYPSVKAPAQELWDDEFWDDEEDSWNREEPITVRGGDDTRDLYDDVPRKADESSWEINRYMRTLPQRATTKRSVRSKEQAPAFEDSSRAWRRDPKARRAEEPVYEEAASEDGPVMPLSMVLLVTAILLTAVAGFGRFHGYRDLDYNWKRAPLLSLVFSGWHEDIRPIAALTQSADKETAAVETDAAETTDSADDTDNAGEAVTEQAPVEVDLNIPEGVNDVVVQATDYGVCNSAYLTPSGTTFETLTEGIFAPNGTYLAPRTVDARYLNDALFIGDSRTDGLHLYGDIKNDAYFWCKEALSVYDVFDAEAVFYAPGDSDGESMTLESALTGEVSFRKIYVSIGINELGTPNTERFYEQYKALLSYIREAQPDALIYIQGIMHVSASYSQIDAAFNNTNIVDKNTAIASLANGRDIFYLDMNDQVCDANGDLLDSLSNDGLHLKASAYAIWKASLLEHAFVRDENDWTAPEAVVNADGTAISGTSGEGTGKPESDISESTGLIVQ